MKVAVGDDGDIDVENAGGGMTVNLTVQIENELIETLRVLDPERQKVLLDFAKFLHNRQSSYSTSDIESASDEKLTSFADGPINLADRGIDKGQAADFRSRLQTFEEDWNHPDMAVYDDM